MSSRARGRPKTRSSIVASAHRDFVAQLRAAKAQAQGEAGAPSTPTPPSPNPARSGSTSGRRRGTNNNATSYVQLHARGNTGSKRAAMRARILQRRASRVHLPVVGPGAVPQSSMYSGGKPRMSVVTTGDLTSLAQPPPPAKKKSSRKPPPPLKRANTESRLLPSAPLEAVAEAEEPALEEEAAPGEQQARERSRTLPAAPPKRPPAAPGGAPADSAAPDTSPQEPAWPVFESVKELLAAACETVALGQDSLRCGAQLLRDQTQAARWAKQEFLSWAHLAQTAAKEAPDQGGGTAAAFPHFWLGTLITAEEGGTLAGVPTGTLQAVACKCGLLQPITAAPGPSPDGKSGPVAPVDDVLDAATRRAAMWGNAAAQQQALAIVTREAVVRLLACGLPVWAEKQKQFSSHNANASEGSVGSSDDTSDSEDDDDAASPAARRPSMLGMQRNSLETLRDVASSIMASLNPRQGIALLHFARCHALSGLGESKAAIAGLLETACTGSRGSSMAEDHVDVVLQSALWWYEGAAEEEVESHMAGDTVSASSCLAAAKLFLSGITPPLATTVYKNRKEMEASAGRNAEMRLRQAAEICGLLPKSQGEADETSPVPSSTEAAEVAELLAGLLQRNALIEQFEEHQDTSGEFLAPKLLPLPPSADSVLLPPKLAALLDDERRQLASPGLFLSRTSDTQRAHMAEVDAMLNAAAQMGSAAAAFGLSIVYSEALTPQADALLAQQGALAVAAKAKRFAELAGTA